VRELLFLLFLIFLLDLRKKVSKMSDEEEYEVESIVSKRIKKGKVKKRLNFLAKAKLFVIVFKRMMQM
jgi:hypothetical protein